MFDSCATRYAPHADLLEAFAQAPAAIALYEGADFRLRFCNAKYGALMGKMPKIGQTVYEIVPGIRHSVFDDYLAAVMTRGETIADDSRTFSLADGAERPRRFDFNFSYSPWRDDTGHIRGVLVIVVDIKGHCRAMAQVAAVDKRLRAMSDALPHAIFIAEPSGKLRYVNSAWRRLTGLDEQTCGPQTWADIIHPEDRPLVESCWLKATQNQAVFDVYARLKHCDGQQYRWQRLMSCCYQENGPDDHVWVGSWTDVHDKMMEDLANAEAQKQFIATLSHDLRTPLAGIRASVEVMQRKKEAALPFEKKFERIIQTVDRADGMIESLLDIDRLTSSTPNAVTFVSLDLADLLGVSVANHCAAHGDRFMAHIPAGIRGLWHGPSVARAVDNLVGNAFKYGGEKTPVTLTVTDDNDTCAIRVHNAGNPIPKEEQPRVFVPYARGPHRNTKGWGLGLSMVVDVAKVHKGAIEVTSDEMLGTTFTLTLRKNPTA